MGPPKFFDAPLHACHVLMTPAGLRNLTESIPLCGLLANVNDCRLHLQPPFRGCTRPQGGTVSLTAYMVPCVRFRPFVRFVSRLSSSRPATLGTGGWLDLARQGLTPCKKRQACLGAHVSGVIVFEDLKKLLESTEFGALHGKVEAENLPRMLQLVRSNRVRFADALGDGIANLIRGTVRYKGFWEEEDLYIEAAGPVVEWTPDTDDAEYFGEGVISLGFEATVDAEIEQPGSYDWYPGGYRPSMEATLNIQGACSLIMDHRDLINPAFHLDLAGVLDRTRLEVDELHYVSIESTERDVMTD
jgi:hypothetical protein